METVCEGLTFSSKMTSGNLYRVEAVPDSIDYHYNYRLWLSKDCQNTTFQTLNCTWFYFSVSGYSPGTSICLQIVNMQNQTKLFRFGHVPLCRTVPSKDSWERLKANVEFKQGEEGYSLTFCHIFPEEENTTTEFAFTYPWTFDEEQNFLSELDKNYSKKLPINKDIYYHREVLCYSFGGKPVDLITVTAPNGAKQEKESKFDWRLFPEDKRCNAFNKKVVLLTARVHPGETPGSFVLMGLLKFLLNRKDPRASRLRKEFVFKIIPMLNPDGVIAGNYRMDCLGVNLNRFYDLPDPHIHPSIYAVKSLAIYHHVANSTSSNGNNLLQKIFAPQEEWENTSEHLNNPKLLNISPNNSGIAFYMDFHGHVSKRGCFIYGNHFKDDKLHTDNIMLAKVISLNCRHFDFESCNFSERMMNCTDVRGQSREGSARVGIHKAIGIVNSYTFECNYNTNRIVNDILPLNIDEPTMYSQKYTKHDFYQIGKDVAVSLLDYCGVNPVSRLPTSQYKNIAGVRLWASKLVQSQRRKSKKSKIKEELPEKVDVKVMNLDTELEEIKANIETKQNTNKRLFPKITVAKKSIRERNQIELPIATVWPFKKSVCLKRKKQKSWLNESSFKNLNSTKISQETVKMKISGIAFFVEI